MHRPRMTIAAAAASALLGAALGPAKGLMAIPRISGPRHQTGPGKKSVLTVHNTLWRSKYSGADLRVLRAERGVGRPPR